MAIKTHKVSMKTVILSSKSSHQDLLTYGPELLDELKSLTTTVMYDTVVPDFSNVTEFYDDEEKLVLFNHFALPDGFALLSKKLPEFKNVKYLLSPYSAYEGLDLELLKKLGIRYRNNGGANAKSVAQYAITAMFMLLSKIPVFTQTKNQPDGSVLGEEYHQKTVGIIGYGNVGQQIATSISRLGMPVFYYNRSSKTTDIAKQVTLEEVMKQDIVFVTIATSDQTKELLKDLPQMLQPHHYLIDISAADDLYDKQKVVDLLNDDKLRGFALEVFEQSTQLRSEKNFLATPHIAWCTIDAEKRTVENYLQRAIAIVKGEAATVDFIV